MAIKHLHLSDLLNESDKCMPIWTYSTDKWIPLSMPIISSESPQLQILFQILTWYALLTSTSFKLLRLYLFITNFRAAHLLTDSPSLIFEPEHSDPLRNYKSSILECHLLAIRSNQSDCESSHQEMSKSIYEYFNVGISCSFKACVFFMPSTCAAFLCAFLVYEMKVLV